MFVKFVRFWVPSILCATGILYVVAHGFSESSLNVGIPVFSAGASIWLLNFLYRLGISGDRDRDTETTAREYFNEHGHWPDQARPTKHATSAQPKDSGSGPASPGRHQ